jgi:hypothetical protein
VDSHFVLVLVPCKVTSLGQTRTPTCKLIQIFTARLVRSCLVLVSVVVPSSTFAFAVVIAAAAADLQRLRTI